MSKCKQCFKEIPLDQAQVGGVHMTCEHQYFHVKDVVMFQIWIEGDENNKCIISPYELEPMILGADEDDTYVVSKKNYSKGEIETLPEFTGF